MIMLNAHSIAVYICSYCIAVSADTDIVLYIQYGCVKILNVTTIFI
jgi:hypothetical protein